MKFMLLNHIVRGEKKQLLKLNNLNKVHLHVDSMLTSSGESLEKEIKFASVCLKRQVY